MVVSGLSLLLEDFWCGWRTFAVGGGLSLWVEGPHGLCRAFMVVVGRASDRSRAVYRTTCRAGADESSKYGWAAGLRVSRIGSEHADS